MERKLKECTLDELVINDEIYLNETDEERYLILDKCPPFLMLESKKSHFCMAYHCVTPLYKEI